MPPKKQSQEEKDLADLAGMGESYGGQGNAQAAKEAVLRAEEEMERRRKEEALKKALGEK